MTKGKERKGKEDLYDLRFGRNERAGAFEDELLLHISRKRREGARWRKNKERKPPRYEIRTLQQRRKRQQLTTRKKARKIELWVCKSVYDTPSLTDTILTVSALRRN